MHKMAGMHKLMKGALLLVLLATASLTLAQKDKDTEPTSWLYFNVVKDDNGKPVRNAAVIMHPVTADGKQGRGDMELKTDPDGKTNFDGVPYGKLRVQVIASGFQTYGDDYDINKDRTEITIKLKRPQGQFSIYDDHPKDSNPPPKQDAPPPDQKDKKPN
ncbi:MAG TPA: carboxypeptidase-like regulatory domain-containing protein [Candidatus Sulfotelmatobacter sp.]|nr:carboxypeptidase-like regulatory domain-containing protein [Candidatus Sulfotelmatobacter sp.]